jgi:hypothetical protein
MNTHTLTSPIYFRIVPTQASPRFERWVERWKRTSYLPGTCTTTTTAAASAAIITTTAKQYAPVLTLILTLTITVSPTLNPSPYLEYKFQGACKPPKPLSQKAILTQWGH